MSERFAIDTDTAARERGARALLVGPEPGRRMCSEASATPTPTPRLSPVGKESCPRHRTEEFFIAVAAAGPALMLSGFQDPKQTPILAVERELDGRAWVIAATRRSALRPAIRTLYDAVDPAAVSSQPARTS
jgi:hypothetical protein